MPPRPVELTAQQRLDAMRLMRAYDIPDEAIGEVFGITRQRVNVLLGRRGARWEKPAAPHPDKGKGLASELRAWRIRRKLTQGEAAALFGVRIMTINAWECGRSEGSMPELVLRHIALLDRYEPPAK